jgi:hypothetical protein
MTDHEIPEDETANLIIYVLDVERMMQKTDGIEVAATMKSLALLLHQVVRGNRDATPDDILYYYIRHVRDLLQFAGMAATITKLQMIIETLQRALHTLEQEADAAPLLKDAWHLMLSVLSREEIKKIAVDSIEFRRGGLDPVVVPTWEQATRIIQEWSTPINENQRVEYRIRYSDGYTDSRWFSLPLFSGSYQIDQIKTLEGRLLQSLTRELDLSTSDHSSFDAAQERIMQYLRRYAVGGDGFHEEVSQFIIDNQDIQWSPGIAYRRWMHLERDPRYGVLEE